MTWLIFLDIPVPILGAIIGNAVGTLLFQTGKDLISEQDAMLLQKYATDLKEYQKQHLSEYAELLNRLNQQLTAYILLLDEAYAYYLADTQYTVGSQVTLYTEAGTVTGIVLSYEEHSEATMPVSPENLSWIIGKENRGI